MFPRNENRNEGTFAKTTLLRNRPFISQWAFLVLTKGWFPKGWFWRMFPRNENRNEGTFAKTTLLRNRPFISQWNIANASAPYRGQNPQNREKRVSGSRTPISHCPRKGRFESKNPHLSTGLHKENGDFSTQSALFRGIGKWEFFDPETLFSRFWGFWPLYRADAFATQIQIPLANISTSSSPDYAIWGPQQPSPGKCWEILGNTGFPIKEEKSDPGNSRKFIRGIPNWHRGWFYFADELAKVDMLGTAEII